MSDFLPSLPSLAAFVAAAVVLALTPGPDMTLFLGRTVAQSRRAGFAALAGAATGTVVHSALAALGLSALLAASETGFMVLKIVGAAYLAWLAFEALWRGSALSLDPGGAPAAIRAVFLRGLLVDLLNPKVIVFFVTFLPQFVSPGDPHAAKKLLFLGLTFAVVSVPVCVPLILFAERVAGALKRSARMRRLIDVMFAGVFGAFAARLLLTPAR